MDSERRHELKQNDLDAGLSGLPGFFKRHGSKVLLVVAFILLGVAVMRYRNNQAAQRQQNVYSSLATANDAIARLQRREQLYLEGRLADLGGSPQWARLSDAEKQQLAGTPATVIAGRSQAENEVRAGVQGVIDNADAEADAAALASAWNAQGELYWQLATAMPLDLPASTQPATQSASTQPTTPPKSTAEYLTLSKQAYEHVVKNFPQQPRPLTAARMSLAAIAETENDFAAARAHYQAITDAADAPAMEKSIAGERLANLDSLAKPALLAPPLPAARPANADPLPPIGSFPMLPGLGTPMPTTQPAIAPTIAPTTMPSTQPTQ